MMTLNLIKSGALLVSTSLVWGLAISNSRYPRIALSAHLNLLQHGILTLAAGLLLKTELVTLEGWQINMVVIPHYLIWYVDFINICNSWWGTNRTLKLLAKESGATGGKMWQEIAVGSAIPVALSLIPAWGVITYKIFYP